MFKKFFVSMLWIGLLPSTYSQSIGEQLIQHLLAHSRNTVVPKVNRNKAIQVSFGVELVHIIELYDTAQLLSAKYWVRQNWTNQLLTWDPKEWGGIEVVSMDPTRVWTPDIVLYNNGDGEFSGGTDKYEMPITMRYDGQHQWHNPATFLSSCRVHTEYFPFDGQACQLKFGSWTYNSKKLTMQLHPGAVVGSNYVPSTEWDIVEASKDHHSVCYKHYGPITYDDITFTIKISRKGLSYLFYLVAPCLIVVFTTLFSFSLPPESGERMIVLVTNLLCFALFLFMTTEVLPHNSDHVPTISVFYIVLMVESSISVLIACYIMTVYHRGRSNNPPPIPAWLKKLLHMVSVKETKKKAKVSDQIFVSSQAVVECMLEKLASIQDIAVGKSGEENSLQKRGMDGEVLEEILGELKYAGKKNGEIKRREMLRHEWEKIGSTLDRLYFWLFLLMVTFSSVCIIAIAYVAQFKFGVPSTEHDEHNHHVVNASTNRIIHCH